MNDHDKFIMESILNCSTFEMLGGEIRAMELNIFEEYVKSKDPIYEIILALINRHSNDEELGIRIYNIKEKLYNYFNN